jgi:hypothetical protein
MIFEIDFSTTPPTPDPPQDDRIISYEKRILKNFNYFFAWHEIFYHQIFYIKRLPNLFLAAMDFSWISKLFMSSLVDNGNENWQRWRTYFFSSNSLWWLKVGCKFSLFKFELFLIFFKILLFVLLERRKSFRLFMTETGERLAQ